METITSTEAQALTDQQLRDEMLHAGYVVSSLLLSGLEAHARGRLEVFKLLREETQRRHG